MQYECENVLNDAALMEACGVGLSRTDMYGVMMVCKQLGEDPKLGVATVRFFGKVLLHYPSAHVLPYVTWCCFLFDCNSSMILLWVALLSLSLAC